MPTTYVNHHTDDSVNTYASTILTTKSSTKVNINPTPVSNQQGVCGTPNLVVCATCNHGIEAKERHNPRPTKPQKDG